MTPGWWGEPDQPEPEKIPQDTPCLLPVFFPSGAQGVLLLLLPEASK